MKRREEGTGYFCEPGISPGMGRGRSSSRGRWFTFAGESCLVHRAPKRPPLVVPRHDCTLEPRGSFLKNLMNSDAAPESLI